MRTSTLFLSCALAIACAPESDDLDATEDEALTEADTLDLGDEDTDDDTLADDVCSTFQSICVDLEVPETYAGTPRELFFTLYTSLPPMGPPDYILDGFTAPALGAGETVSFDLVEGVPLSGAYRLSVVLFDVNGGTMLPAEGIDYVAESAEALVFTGDAIDAGTLTLQPY